MPKLEQEKQFNPTHDHVASILHGWGIEQFTLAIPEHGVENLSLFISTSDRDYVLRVFKQSKKPDAAITLEIEFCNFLHERFLPAPLFLALTTTGFMNKTTIQGLEWTSVLMERLPGKQVFSRLSTEQIIDMAGKLSSLHELSQEFCSQRTFEQATSVRDTYVDEIDISQAKYETTRNFLRRDKDHVLQVGKLPQTLIHGDFGAGNILFTDHAVTGIVDFDDIYFGPVVEDVAIALRRIYKEDRSLADLRLFLQTYTAAHPLTQAELEMIQPYMLFRCYIIGCVDYLLYGEDSPELQYFLQEEQDLHQLDYRVLLSTD